MERLEYSSIEDQLFSLRKCADYTQRSFKYKIRIFRYENDTNDPTIKHNITQLEELYKGIKTIREVLIKMEEPLNSLSYVRPKYKPQF